MEKTQAAWAPPAWFCASKYLASSLLFSVALKVNATFIGLHLQGGPLMPATLGIS